MRLLLRSLGILVGITSFAVAQEDGPLLRVRLLSPLSTGVSKPGDAVEAVVVAPLAHDGVIRIDSGARVLGRVVQVRSVGLGLRRERAKLAVEFDTLDPTGLGDHIGVAAHLVEVENARESVTRPGELRGVLAADNPNGLMRGLWFRPHSGMFHRSALGMTGLASRLPVGPMGSVAFMAFRCLLFRLPEPEIQLPIGTDLELAVAPQALAALPPSELLPSALPALPSELAEWLAAQPASTDKPDGKRAQDVVNVVAVGSAKDLETAFLASGWSATDQMTARSFARAYKAYTTQKGYPNAPVSKLFYQGREPDVVYQKSFNTLHKRHHVRFWRVTLPNGQEAWLGAGTHDTGVMLDRARLSVTHEIDPRIDRERERIVADLTFTGCASEFEGISRESLPVQPGIVTDGRLSVLGINSCVALPDADRHHHLLAASRSAIFRATRRITLETRQYMLRGNVYYFAYRAVRSGFRRGSDRGVQLARGRGRGGVLAAAKAGAVAAGGAK